MASLPSQQRDEFIPEAPTRHDVEDEIKRVVEIRDVGGDGPAEVRDSGCFPRHRHVLHPDVLLNEEHGDGQGRDEKPRGDGEVNKGQTADFVRVSRVFVQLPVAFVIVMQQLRDDAEIRDGENSERGQRQQWAVNPRPDMQGEVLVIRLFTTQHEGIVSRGDIREFYCPQQLHVDHQQDEGQDEKADDRVALGADVLRAEGTEHHYAALTGDRHQHPGCQMADPVHQEGVRLARESR